VIPGRAGHCIHGPSQVLAPEISGPLDPPTPALSSSELRLPPNDKVTSVIAWMLAGILGTISLLYLYWALGGMWLTDKSAPVVDGKPLIRMSRTSALGAACATFMLAAVPVISMRPLLRKCMLALIMAAFAYRAVGDFRYMGFFKSVNNSSFSRWDTRVYSPFALLVSVLAGFLIFR
jgi:hypothetical protein